MSRDIMSVDEEVDEYIDKCGIAWVAQACRRYAISTVTPLESPVEPIGCVTQVKRKRKHGESKQMIVDVMGFTEKRLSQIAKDSDNSISACHQHMQSLIATGKAEKTPSGYYRLVGNTTGDSK
jgi:predicted Rossmann fold nucleotide-binding protein DprA/Smf involved in DNA uptake